MMKDDGGWYICISSGSTLVRNEEFAVVLEKNVDPGRRPRESVQREWLTFLSGVSYLYSSVAAQPG